MERNSTHSADLFSDEHLEELGFRRYTGAIPFDQIRFPNEPVPLDLEWASTDPEVHRKYCGKVVAVHNRVVWGVGKNYQAAWDDAQAKPGCPPAEEMVFAVV